jgi:hypothetical protein
MLNERFICTQKARSKCYQSRELAAEEYKQSPAITSAIARKKRPGASLSDATNQHNGEDIPLDDKSLKRHLGSKKASLEVSSGLYTLFLSMAVL